MSSLNLLDAIKTKFSAKFVLALLMSFMLTACGAGGEDSLGDSANIESQTPTEEVEEQVPEEVTAVQISSQPQSATKNSGENVNFTVSASGGGSLSFQWRKNQQAIQGATSSTLSLSNLSDSDGALYDVVVSNSAGSVNSLSALLTVNTSVVIEEPVVDPVVIVLQPKGITVNESDSASFSVQATGDGEITYQWLKNGEIISGADSASYSLSAVSTNDAAGYSVIVSNSEGPVVSNAANLSVTVVQLASSIELTWDIPEAREDGSDLALGEINGYVIAYGSDENNMSTQLTVEGASTTNTVLENLTTGTYFFSIATVDSDGVQGAYSSVIQQSI
tara:strand:- start:30962 stop:31963 length:1002 start_codon:yes stop_codon:yes gene_type:complete